MEQHGQYFEGKLPPDFQVKNFFVYGIQHPRTGKFWYVGVTHDPGKRALEHLVHESSTLEVDKLRSELALQDLQPRFVIVEVVRLLWHKGIPSTQPASLARSREEVWRERLLK